MKYVYVCAVIEFLKKDEETQNDVIKIVKGNIENSLGDGSVKYISICDESGECE